MFKKFHNDLVNTGNKYRIGHIFNALFADVKILLRKVVSLAKQARAARINTNVLYLDVSTLSLFDVSLFPKPVDTTRTGPTPCRYKPDLRFFPDMD